MLQDEIDRCFANATPCEIEFAKLFKTAFKSTPYQDMKEHWDVGVHLYFGTPQQCRLLFDVKSMKKTLRSDEDVDETIHYIEFKNVGGFEGWAYGKADFFAFEQKDSFIIVGKYALQKYMKEKVFDEFKPTPEFNYKYQRSDRKDVMSKIHTSDLIEISNSILYKKK